MRALHRHYPLTLLWGAAVSVVVVLECLKVVRF